MTGRTPRRQSQPPREGPTRQNTRGHRTTQLSSLPALREAAHHLDGDDLDAGRAHLGIHGHGRNCQRQDFGSYRPLRSGEMGCRCLPHESREPVLKRQGAILDPIPRHDFERARKIAQSPVLQRVARDMTASTGRKRAQSWDAIFTVLALSAVTGGGLLLSEAHRASARLSAEQRNIVGLTGTIPYSQVESAVTDLCQGFEERVNSRTGECSPPRITMDFDDLTTSLTASVLPRKLRRSRSVAIDSTDFESHYRRRSTNPDKTTDAVDEAPPQRELTAPQVEHRDPTYPKIGDDGRYIHCADHQMREGYRAGKNGRKKETFIGLDLHLGTPVADLDSQGHGSLITGFVARPAGDSKAEAGLALMDSMLHTTGHTELVLADRGYTYLKHENWADQLMARNLEQVLDLHTNQRVVRPGPIPGTIWVDGGLFVDALPDRLRHLPGFGRNLTSQAERDLCALYDERDTYAFKPMGSPNLPRRTQRLRGPARDGRLRCPNAPKSMRWDPATRPTTNCPPGSCSCASTPTIGPEDMTQTRQRVRFGTTDWARSYGRRSAIESANSSVKVHHSHVRRGSVRVMGVRRSAFLLAFCLAATNIRVLLDCYGFDPGRDHSEDVEVKPLPTVSRAQRRSPFHRRLGKARPARAPAPQRKRPDTTAWRRKQNTKN